MTLFETNRGRLGMAAIVSGLMLSCSHMAFAQQSAAPAATPEDQSAGLEEIIVTSRKVAEKLQSTPVTVSVVSGQMLQELDIDRPEDLARLTPGFHYEETGARYFNKPTIRGLTVNSIEYANQKAQTFIDGIAFAGQFGSYPTDDGEIERVEVLKGPQSTAFGRGTLAGGVSYITKDPANYFSGIASAEYRTNDETHDYLFLNVPIIEDILTSYLSVNYYSYGGPPGAEWHDSYNNQQLSNESSQDIAAKFKLTPNDWLTVKARASYGFDDDGIATFNFLAPSQRNGSFQNGAVYLPVGPISVSSNQTASPDDQMSNPGLRRETWRSELDTTADLGPLTLTSVTGLNRQNDRVEYGAEASGSPYWYYLSPVYYGTTGT
jgi:iron complex outermembrane receptor protein